MQDYLINNVLNYYCGPGGRERESLVCVNGDGLSGETDG